MMHTQKVIGNRRMRNLKMIEVLKVAFDGGFSELLMIPVEYNDAVGRSFAQISGQVRSNTTPQQRRNATNWRQMVLVNVIEHFVIQRDQIFYLQQKQQ